MAEHIYLSSVAPRAILSPGGCPIILNYVLWGPFIIFSVSNLYTPLYSPPTPWVPFFLIDWNSQLFTLR
jgi:hypothetical protein